MKKLLVILLLLIYGGSSFGMTLYFHYCCNQLQDVALSQPRTEDCMDEAHHETNEVPCCDSKEVVLKIKDVQSPAKTLYVVEPTPAIIDNCIPVIAVSLIGAGNGVNPAYLTPPPLEKNFNHLYCIYRI